MRKKLHTQFSKTKINCSSNIERAKELYFINFANHITMKKNGEFKEYSDFQVSKETEYRWSLEVKEKLINEICNDGNLLQVVPLSRINLPENEIIDAFKLLFLSCQRNEILTTIKQLNQLFEPNIYKRIIEVFED